MSVSFYEADDPSFSVLMDSFSKKKCPCCHATNSPLSAFLIITVKSFLLFTSKREEIVVGCASCITSSARKANIKSILFGWWGFPLGPLSTIFALMHNWEVYDPSFFEEADEELREYILENVAK